MEDISVCSPLNSLPELLCLFLYCCSLWLSCKHTIIYALELKIKFREQHENVVPVFFIHCFSLFLLFFVLSWLFLFLFPFFKTFPFFRYQKLNKSRVQYIQCKNALSPVLKLFFYSVTSCTHFLWNRGKIYNFFGLPSWNFVEFIVCLTIPNIHD